MLIQQSIEFVWKVPGPTKTGYFYDKNLQGKSSSDYLLLEILLEAMYIASPN